MEKINLKKREIVYLNAFVRRGNKSARALTRARILLLAHKGKKNIEIQETLNISRSTIWHTKKKYLREDIEYALTERERPGQPRKYNDKQITEIIASACTDPPKGRKRWTIRLLAQELSNKEGFKTINRETIRLILKKTTPSLG